MNKKTIIIAMGLALVLTACANTAVDTATGDSTIAEVAEASIGNSVVEEVNASTEASSEDASIEVSAEASSEEISTEASASESTSEVIDLTTAEAEGTEITSTATKSEGNPTGKTGANGWPVISGYKGNGNGPGLAWRDDYDYVNDKNIQGNFNDIIAFTASNGVTIKVVVSYNGDTPIYWPISDGEGKDLEPNSAWNKAINEAMYGPNGAYNATDLSANVNATLPNTSYKRTSIDPNDSQVAAYKQAYDYKRSTCDGGTYYPRPAGTINDSIFFFTDGVGEYDKKGVALWEFRRVGDYWSFTIYQNPAEYQWSGISEVLSYIDPNGTSLAQLFSEDYYSGRQDVMPEFDEWYSYGSNQVMITSESMNAGAGVHYLFN